MLTMWQVKLIVV